MQNFLWVKVIALQFNFLADLEPIKASKIIITFASNDCQNRPLDLRVRSSGIDSVRALRFWEVRI